MPRFSNFLRNSIIHFPIFFIFGNMFPESHGFVVVSIIIIIIIIIIIKMIVNARPGEGD